jgi:putative membrane protein
MKKFLAALAVTVSALAFAADPPSDAPRKTEQQPTINEPTLGRADDTDARTAVPRNEPVVADKSAASDAECLARLHHDNEMEIQMGKLARKNSQSKQVKAYGEMLIKDHTLADKQIMQLARRQDLDLTMPAPKNETEQAEMQASMDAMKRLETLKGEEFDREFAKLMVEDHQKAIDLIEGTLTTTTDDKVRGLLNKVLPVIKEHKRTAETINKKLQSV